MSGQGVVTPDFAFPKTSAAKALKALNRALDSGNEPDAMANLIAYSVSTQSIGSENMPRVISLIDSVRGVSQNKPVMLAMLDLYEAETLQWSGEQSHTRILNLIDNALSYRADLRKTPLVSWKAAITQDDLTREYYPSLYNFIAFRAIDLLTGRKDNDSRILAIYDSLISSPTEALTPPAVLAATRRLGFTLEYGTEKNALAEYLALYHSLKSKAYNDGSDCLGEVLIEAPVYGTDMLKQDYYATCKEFLKQFPNYARRGCLESILASMDRAGVSLSTPMSAPKGRPVEIQLNLSNTAKGKVSVYNVSMLDLFTSYATFPKTGLPGKLVATLPFEVEPDRLPYNRTVNLEYTFPEYGTYILVPESDNLSPRGETFSKIYVSDIVLGRNAFDSQCSVLALSGLDGTPLEGVEIKGLYRRNSTSQPTVLGHTDISGMLPYTSGKYMELAAVSGTDRYTAPLGIQGVSDRTVEWNSAVRGFTSLPLYHPGDTIDWAAVCYEIRGISHRVMAGRKVTAVLHDPTYQPLDTLELVTDDYGRIHGRFATSKDNLTGSFSITIDNRTAVRVEVSDYKLPTYEVTLSPAETVGGAITLRGNAVAYSGFPVEGASVKISVTVSNRPRRWWGPIATSQFFDGETQTDTRGDFSITIPDSVMQSSPYPHGIYEAQVAVTSASGESRDARMVFAPSTTYTVQADIANDIDLSKPLDINAKVVDYRDSVIHCPISLTLTDADHREVWKGLLPERLTGVDPGEYTLSLAAEGVEADTLRRDVVLYSPSSTVSPAPDKLLWTPVHSLSLIDGKGRWLCAVNAPTHLLVSLYDDRKVLSEKWIAVEAGQHNIDVQMPEGVDACTMQVMCVANYQYASETVSLRRADTEKGIRIVTETFRDRLVPGRSETWTFRITNLQGTPTQGAVMAGLYNKALDAISSSSWAFTPGIGYVPHLHTRFSPLDSRNYTSVSANFPKTMKCRDITPPQFNTYGFSPRYRGHLLNSIKIRGAKPMAAGAVEEVMEVETADFASYKMADMAVASADGGVMLTDEEADDAEVSPEANDETFDFRPSEVPLAFFRPEIVSDADGGFSIQFEVPEANTTWRFRTLAFTDSLLTNLFERDVIASKPVMVKPNPPRFVRQGDTVDIITSVMNASDTLQSLLVVTEVFNPVTNEVMQRISEPLTLEAEASQTVSITIHVNETTSLLGFRVKAVGATHSDGEQTLIPALPATTPVIETEPFYLAPNQADYSTVIPARPADARVTLQYCDNPAWYVVTALPGLLDAAANTAPEAARSIFSASVAAGLLRNYPAIASALREWNSSNRSDSTLVSMLERNRELKTVLLQATPWLNDADSDTERMARLALLFDSDNIKSVLDANIKTLQSLQQPHGLILWHKQFISRSLWATTLTLTNLGMLHRLGYLPDDARLNRVIAKALQWHNIEAARDFYKNPKGDYTSFLWINTLFMGFSNVPHPDDRIIDATINRILAQWPRSSVAEKADYAYILHYNQHPRMARRILESLREYAVTDSVKGTWFPSLDDDSPYSALNKVNITSRALLAFKLIEPKSREVDLLRQWLVMQKGAENWGSSSTATLAVAAILASGTDWMVPSGHTTVTLAGDTLAVQSPTRLTGEFTMKLPVKADKSETLSLHRTGNTPAWGAVYSRFTSRMDTVKPASCPELSISKQLVSDSDSPLAVGRKVKVTLTVTATRDMDYVVITDDRPACFEPVEQLSGWIWCDRISFYRENRDASTRLYISHLPKGIYNLTYEMWINNAGTFSSGIATAQSQYAPRFTAHSAGETLKIFDFHN